VSEDATTPELDEVDRWRAGMHALIGRLFYAGPDAALLAQLAGESGGAGDTPLAAAWRQLAAASRWADPQALQHEHAMLFVGVGKTPVTPYTSAYVSGVSPERHLLQLRETLAEWGLAGDPGAGVPEDHLAGVCDTLRHLILQGMDIATQKAFFESHVHAPGIKLCEALRAVKPSPFYVAVADLAVHFWDVEREGFEMVS
jgi:TorA maturation chaperone TorD